MSNKISELTSKRNKLIADAQALVNAGKTDSPEYRAMTIELDTIQSDIDALSFIEARLSKLPAPVTASVAAPAIIQSTSKNERAKVNDAARQFFRNGAAYLNAEQRAILTTSDSAGGAFIAQAFDDSFVEASKFFGPIFNLVHRKDSDGGEPTKFVVTDGTNQTFSLLAEGTTSAASVAQQPTVFSDVTGTDTLVSSVIYSSQEVQDAFDLTDFLLRIAGLAVSRARETAITLSTSNDGTNTALPNSPTGGFLANVTAGVTQTDGTLAAGPTYSQLNSLAGSVDRSYYQNGAYMASPSVETFLRGQVDSTGRPLYAIDANTGYLQIAGRPLYPNASMPAAGTASSPLVLFGDYSKAWNVQNAGVSLKVIANDENPTLAMFTRELIVWTRLGQSAGLSTAVKSLVSAAS